MELATLNAETREQTGKGAARSLRREGTLPAVIYRAGESTPLMVNEKELMHLLRHTDGRLSLLNLQFKDNTTKLAIVKKYQVHPVYGNILHLDFQEVGADEELTLLVEVNLTGEAIGVKRDSGILEHSLRQIEVRCLPDNVPAHIDLDITEVEAGHSLHVSDITPPEGVSIITDPKEIVAVVSIPALVEEEVEEELAEGEEGAEAAEGEEGAEGAEAAEGKEEPEDKKKKKKEEK